MPESSYLSVIVPCFNESEIIERSHRRLVHALGALSKSNYEIIYVDDGSADGTFTLLDQLAQKDSRVRIVQFTRNFGHQPAIMAGLAHSTGDRVVVLDSDMQDPPELLGEMLQRMDASDADVVYGLRIRREGESWIKKLVSKVYYRLLHAVSDVDVPTDVGDFRLMRRTVVAALVALPEKRKYVRGLTVWLGFAHMPFPYVREPRMGGTAKYSVGKLLELAVAGFTSFGSRALILPWILAPILVAAMVAAGFWGATRTWADRQTVLLVFIATGILAVLICLGVLGLFVGRLLEEIRARPAYVVRTRVNFV